MSGKAHGEPIWGSAAETAYCSGFAHFVQKMLRGFWL